MQGPPIKGSYGQSTAISVLSKNNKSILQGRYFRMGIKTDMLLFHECLFSRALWYTSRFKIQNSNVFI